MGNGRLLRGGICSPPRTVWLHGQAFSPALFYKVGRAGLDAGGGGGEREKKRNRGKEGTPAGWAEGEAEAKLGSGAAAPARLLPGPGHPESAGDPGPEPTRRRRRRRRHALSPGLLAGPAPAPRGAGAVGAAQAAVRPGVFVREPRSAPLRMSLCVSPGSALRAPRGVCGTVRAPAAPQPSAVLPSRLALVAPRRLVSLLSELPPPASSPSHLTAKAGFPAPPPSPTLACLASARCSL
ncbi:hypothetical protein P7K49_035959 [Saguinus oedipus]|uniref:Uncharacterized protein n=1 Tax=Saguinus oedipus TaxID=9490 RepID=A0ABQ9TP35_SAGOE|nr:hypothetical protein P7K49_035959 [Saguinus oedipus]